MENHYCVFIGYIFSLWETITRRCLYKGVQKRSSYGAPQQTDKRNAAPCVGQKCFFSLKKNRNANNKLCLFFFFLSGRLGGSSRVLSVDPTMVVNNTNTTKEGFKPPTSENTHLCSHWHWNKALWNVFLRLKGFFWKTLYIPRLSYTPHQNRQACWRSVVPCINFFR